MKKEQNLPRRFDSLSEFHRVFGLAQPLHPLISLIDIEAISILPDENFDSFVLNFYLISFKSMSHGKVKYGQHYYDFGEGGMAFSAPNQVLETPTGIAHTGWLLLVHPDFFSSYTLAKKIKEYGFFSYTADEALHLSEGERKTISAIVSLIDEELKSRIDDFSHDVVVSQLDLLLSYCCRFYKRQFLTRKVVFVDLLHEIENLLEQYFNSDDVFARGLPSVQYLAGRLNRSPGYLSDMLRSLTGRSAQQHIHDKLIEKAKEKLSSSKLSISEIAYLLGFEHPQSFSKLFKAKTKLSPGEFRQSFN